MKFITTHMVHLSRRRDLRAISSVKIRQMRRIRPGITIKRPVVGHIIIVMTIGVTVKSARKKIQKKSWELMTLVKKAIWGWIRKPGESQDTVRHQLCLDAPRIARMLFSFERLHTAIIIQRAKEAAWHAVWQQRVISICRTDKLVGGETRRWLRRAGNSSKPRITYAAARTSRIDDDDAACQIYKHTRVGFSIQLMAIVSRRSSFSFINYLISSPSLRVPTVSFSSSIIT